MSDTDEVRENEADAVLRNSPCCGCVHARTAVSRGTWSRGRVVPLCARFDMPVFRNGDLAYVTACYEKTSEP